MDGSSSSPSFSHHWTSAVAAEEQSVPAVGSATIRCSSRRAGRSVGTPQRDLSQDRVLGGGHVRFDQHQQRMLVPALVGAHGGAEVEVGVEVEEVRLAVVVDRLLELDPQPSHVHRPRADREVAVRGRGADRIAVVRGCRSSDQIEQLEPALVRQDLALLVLLRLERDSPLLRRYTGVAPRPVVGKTGYICGGHGLPLFVSAVASNGGIGMSTGVRPTGMYSSSLIRSDRSLTATAPLQKAPISEPSWLPARMLGGPAVLLCRISASAVPESWPKNDSPNRRLSKIGEPAAI